MKAIVWTNYGPPDVLQLTDIDKPSPKPNELLIRIRATTVTAGDCEMRAMNAALRYRIPMRAYVGFSKPTRITILGMELSGVVESIGEEVTKFKPGDEVFAATGFIKTGTYTEYICLPEEPYEGALAIKPTTMTFEEAAPVPVGGLEALSFVKLGNIEKGNNVLINGAGGTIGCYAVQLAKYFGAEVTAVDSTRKIDMLHSIGADHVIDYTQTDFTKNDRSYDFILDVVSKSSFSDSINSLKENGHYLIANPGPSTMVRSRFISKRSDKTVLSGAVSFKSQDLLLLRNLIEKGKLQTVIDKKFKLEQIREAHTYVETGEKIGNVVIIIDHN
jgi:NADPH:quinone reductase-like Zn-dependent oxidoreductase